MTLDHLNIKNLEALKVHKISLTMIGWIIRD